MVNESFWGVNMSSNLRLMLARTILAFVGSLRVLIEPSAVNSVQNLLQYVPAMVMMGLIKKIPSQNRFCGAFSVRLDRLIVRDKKA